MNEKQSDGRKYDVGDKVTFTDDAGQQVPGIIHAVRYQQGVYELVGAQHENPADPSSAVIPGTGQMELVKGTEHERHDFEYIVVNELDHKAWWNTEHENQMHIANGHHQQVKPHPELKQHIRVFEED